MPERYKLKPLTAYLHINPHHGAKYWFFYDVVFEGERVVKCSFDPECDLARVLKKRGYGHRQYPRWQNWQTPHDSLDPKGGGAADKGRWA